MPCLFNLTPSEKAAVLVSPNDYGLSVYRDTYIRDEMEDTDWVFGYYTPYSLEWVEAWNKKSGDTLWVYGENYSTDLPQSIGTTMIYFPAPPLLDVNSCQFHFVGSIGRFFELDRAFWNTAAAGSASVNLTIANLQYISQSYTVEIGEAPVWDEDIVTSGSIRLGLGGIRVDTDGQYRMIALKASTAVVAVETDVAVEVDISEFVATYLANRNNYCAFVVYAIPTGYLVDEDWGNDAHEAMVKLFDSTCHDERTFQESGGGEVLIGTITAERVEYDSLTLAVHNEKPDLSTGLFALDQYDRAPLQPPPRQAP